MSSDRFRTRLKPLALAVSGALALLCALRAQSAGPLPPRTLPDHRTVVTTPGTTVSAPVGNTLNIKQTTPSAILKWQSFNIGADGKVRFEQPGTSSVALNRIFSADPSRIEGALSANGQIYLINQNGIIFAPGAKVDVHSLVASSLDISDELFTNGFLTNPLPAEQAAFAAFPNGLPTGMVVVENGARIETARGGRVMLLAPDVSNNGVIHAPDGQVILAAGTKVYVAASQDTSLRGLLVEVDNGGKAANLNLGQLVAERGNISLVGLAVNQSGLARATTSVNVNGSIRLLARDTVVGEDINGVRVPKGSQGGSLVLGKGSRTEVAPELNDKTTTQDSQTFQRSAVELAGLSVRLQEGSAIRAPGGQVSVTAQRSQTFQGAGSSADPDAKVFFEAGSVIDVAGSTGVSVAMERNSVAAELRGNELRDAPLLRNGPLRGQTVYVDARKGTPLADVSGFLGQVGRDVGERTASGGDITVRSEGSVILSASAGLDVAGGSILYRDGYIKTSQLVGADGRLYDIGIATPDREYVGIAGSFTVEHKKWGVTETFTSPSSGEFVGGFAEGRNAGSISVVGHAVVLEGNLRGKATAGPYQRDAGKIPLGGKLIVGDASQAGAESPDFRLGDIRILRTTAPAGAGLTFASPLADLPTGLELSVQKLTDAGFSRLAAYGNGSIIVPKETRLEFQAGSWRGRDGKAETSALTLVGREIDFAGSVQIPGGVIALTTVRPLSATSSDPAQFGLRVRDSARVDATGVWVNDALVSGLVTPTNPIVLNGGSIALTSIADVVLERGSVIDVSAGAARGQAGTLQVGDAGSISVRSGRLGLSSFDRQVSSIELDAELRGYALGTGGALAISTSQVLIGGVPSGSSAPGTIALPVSFFGRGGFASFAVNGQDGLVVADRAAVRPLTTSWVLQPGFEAAPTGTRLATLVSAELLPDHLRAPTRLELTANSKAYGDLELGEGASIAADPQSQVEMFAGRQLTLFGTLDVPSGDITIETAEAQSGDAFVGSQTIWLGANARILARGTPRLVPSATGQREGEVLGGGEVTIRAGRGYVVSKAGALIDVSGASATLDLPADVGGRRVLQPKLITSDAGSIDMRAQQGALLDGAMLAQGDGGARHGSFSLTLDAPLPADSGFPSGTRTLIVIPRGGAVPVGLRPGDVVDPNAGDPALSTVDRKAIVAAATLEQGAFDRVVLRSPEVLELRDGADLSTRLSLGLDAPTIQVTGSTVSVLQSAYVSLGNSSVFAPATPASGGGRLQVQADLIDLEGDLALSGFGEVAFRSAGDIRLKGAFLPATDVLELRGALTTTADLSFQAAQLYPTTASQYAIRVIDRPDGRIVVAQSGARGATPLSAAGSLRLEAPEIRQGGTLRAPFGQIALDASSVLTLLPGSLTSVAGDGRIVPFGRTEFSGRDWIYDLGQRTKRAIQTLPEKTIDLRAPALAVLDGATIDISGSGDLHAAEFIFGPGGSEDLTDPGVFPNSYAVLPGYSTPFAPYDHQDYRSGQVPALASGDRVYLSAAGALQAGTYTLLPARYALLPGAFLVTQQTGGADFLPSDGGARPDGSYLASGYRLTQALDGSVLRDARSSAFEVLTGSVLRTRGEYVETLANQYFAARAGTPLPADAGRLALEGTSALRLDGTIAATFGANRRGAELDIAAPKLAIVAGGASVGADYVALSVETLNAAGVGSVLLGGKRTRTSEGLVVTPVSDSVVFAATPDGGLSASEIMAVSRDIEVQSGAVLRGSGQVAAVQDSRIILPGAANFLRVASSPLIPVVRREFDPAAATGGVISVGAATLLASGSVTLDASRNAVISNDALVTSPAWSIAAGRLNLGEAVASVDGLQLSESLLRQASSAKVLTLKSYSVIDFSGTTTLGELDAATGLPSLAALVLDSPALTGSGAGLTEISARQVTLTNSSGLVADVSEPSGAGRQLSIRALGSPADGGTLVLADGAMAIGFEAVSLLASREVRIGGNGALQAEGGLSLDTGRIVGLSGADYAINAGGRVQVAATFADPGNAVDSVGVKLAIAGSSIDFAGRLVLPSGRVQLEATDAAGGSVAVAAGGVLNLAGYEVRFDDVYSTAPAGLLRLRSASGDVMLAEGSRVVLSGAEHGGDAGRISVSAPLGKFVAAPVVAGRTHAETDDGLSVELDVGRIDSFSSIGALFAGADTIESLDVRVRSGDFTLGATDSVRAPSVVIAADGGSVSIAGRIETASDDGGKIAIWARDDLTLASGSVLNAAAVSSRGRGGRVMLGATEGDVALLEGSRIDVTGDLGQGGREVVLRARRTANDVHVSAVDGTVVGSDGVVVEAYEVYNAATLTTSGTSTPDGNLNVLAASTDPTSLYEVTAAYMSTARPNVTGRLGSGVRLRPGIEIRSPGGAGEEGELALDSNWNLCGSAPGCASTDDRRSWRFDGEPGVLTLRSEGDLAINANLSDGFSSATPAGQLQAGQDWSYRLVAGADLTSANPTVPRSALAAGDAGKGNFTIGAGRLVRTGTGTIDVAARGDFKLADSAAVLYTAGDPSTPLPGYLQQTYTEFENGTTVNAAPVFPTQGGDISIVAGRDVSAARSEQLISDWLYRRTPGLNSSSEYTFVNPQTTWWPRFNTFRQGVGTLGGGNILVRAGGDISDMSVVAPTNGHIGGAVDQPIDPALVSIQGGGNVLVKAGHDIRGGIFYVARGRGLLEAQGAVVAGSELVVSGGSLSVKPGTVVAIGDAPVQVRATGTVAIETAINPTLLTQPSIELPRGLTQSSSFSTLTARSSLSVQSLTGDVNLSNNPNGQVSRAHPKLFGDGGDTNAGGLNLYPGTVTLSAPQGSIDSGAPFSVFPAETGNLVMLARQDIILSGAIVVSDVSPAALPRISSPASGFGTGALGGVGRYNGGVLAHSNPPLHAGDPEPIRIQARDGSLRFADNAILTVPKAARLIAGLDIVDPDFGGQNLSANDLTQLRAGRDILSVSKNEAGAALVNNRTIQVGGLGRLEIVAGRDIDLGTSSGVVTRGNLDNPLLSEGGADITMIAGFDGGRGYSAFIDRYYDPAASDDASIESLTIEIVAYMSAIQGRPLSTEEALAAFKELNAAHAQEVTNYMRELAGNPSLGTAEALEQFRVLPADAQRPVIHQTLFEELKQGGRDVAKYGSSAYSRGYAAAETLFGGAADATRTGDLSLFFSQLKTEQGGAVNMVVPHGAVNAGLASTGDFAKRPSELGIFTISGGDIRGFVRDDFLVNQSRVFTLGGGDILLWSSEGDIDAGKGAKTASATPPPTLRVDARGNFFLDATSSISGSGIGVLLGSSDIEPGDVDLIAPRGTVNAGDAGIRVAGNLNIAALRVIGADNIQVGGAATGVPVAPPSVAAGLTGLSGAVVEATQSAERATDAAMAETSQTESSFMPSFVTVEVIGLGEEEEEDEKRKRQ